MNIKAKETKQNTFTGIQPIGNQVLIRFIEVDVEMSKTRSGILLLDERDQIYSSDDGVGSQEKKAPKVGIIEAFGPVLAEEENYKKWGLELGKVAICNPAMMAVFKQGVAGKESSVGLAAPSDVLATYELDIVDKDDKDKIVDVETMKEFFG